MGIALILMAVFIYGYAIIGTGPRWNHKNSVRSGIGCVLVFCIVLGLFLLLEGQHFTKSSRIIKADTTDIHSIIETKYYYVEKGERYHKTANCPTLHASVEIYEAYFEDIPYDKRTPCGVCKPYNKQNNTTY